MRTARALSVAYVARDLLEDAHSETCVEIALLSFSDLSEPGRGNTWVIPGTHKLGHDSPNPSTRDGIDGGSRQPQGAIPLLVPPNSCVIFDRRLLHASSPNWSEHERKVRWCATVHK